MEDLNYPALNSWVGNSLVVEETKLNWWDNLYLKIPNFKVMHGESMTALELINFTAAIIQSLFVSNCKGT